MPNWNAVLYQCGCKGVASKGWDGPAGAIVLLSSHQIAKRQKSAIVLQLIGRTAGLAIVLGWMQRLEPSNTKPRPFLSLVGRIWSTILGWAAHPFRPLPPLPTLGTVVSDRPETPPSGPFVLPLQGAWQRWSMICIHLLCQLCLLGHNSFSKQTGCTRLVLSCTKLENKVV